MAATRLKNSDKFLLVIGLTGKRELQTDNSISQCTSMNVRLRKIAMSGLG